MNEKKHVILKPGKDKAIRQHHHWIFSGAIQQMPKCQAGDILPVYSSDGDFLGSGYFNPESSILGRMLSYDLTPPMDAITQNLDNAINLRKMHFDHHVTNAYRLINAEGDYLPGLVVDKYDDVAVIQIGTKGMDNIRPFLLDYLSKKLDLRCIYEKSLLGSRKEEGLKDQEGVLWGEKVDRVEVRENKLKFYVSLVKGQKTGFFLDHREMRNQVKELSKNKRVLNCFAYTGGFSVYAVAGHAQAVDTVEISDYAIEMAQENMKLNEFSVGAEHFYSQDVFQFLRENDMQYDLVILDPPAFAKKKKDIIPACRGYKDINRLALQKMPKNSILLTSSCSYYVDEALFQKVVFQASVEANRKVRIIGRHRLAIDHPLNICHPEGDYLKSLLLYIE